MRKNNLCKLMFILIFRPLVWIFLGLSVKDRNRLPMKGPAILIANHNSHLDTIVLMSLYPIRNLFRIRPVAAEDYFLHNFCLNWFCKHVLQIIPISRIIHKKKINPLQKIEEALQEENIVIFYPEGTRGEPEKMGEFKKGIVRLAEKYPEIPIIPVFLQGLGKALPKGKNLLVPFNIKAVIGKPIQRPITNKEMAVHLYKKIELLSKDIKNVA